MRKFDASEWRGEYGTFWDGERVFIACEYWDDEPEDGDDGKGYINAIYEPHEGAPQECDAFYYGYKTIPDLLEGEFTTDCWVVANDACDAETIDVLAEYLMSMGINLWKEIANE